MQPVNTTPSHWYYAGRVLQLRPLQNGLTARGCGEYAPLNKGGDLSVEPIILEGAGAGAWPGASGNDFSTAGSVAGAVLRPMRRLPNGVWML